MTKELTDAEICNIARNTQTAEPGRDGYILPAAFARAVIASDRELQAAEIEHLTGVIATCRTIPPAPTKGSAAEPYWAGAMCAPEHVPAYIKAAFEAQAAKIARLKRGEFVCSKCGIRKDAEQTHTHDF